MSLRVNHLRVLMSQPTDRRDGCPARHCLAPLLPSSRLGHHWPASMSLQQQEDAGVRSPPGWDVTLDSSSRGALF